MTRGTCGWVKADQLDVLLFGLGAEYVQAVLDQRVEVELHIIQLDLPGLELGNVGISLIRVSSSLPAVDGLHVSRA